MKSRLFAALALVAGMMAAPQVANATSYVAPGHSATGYVTADLNLRACASTRCAQIAVMPRGSQVWLGASQGNWYQVTWRGRTGWASASYISHQYAAAPPVYHPPVVVRRPPVVHRPPVVVYPRQRWHGYQRPPRRQWNQPNGFYFGYNYGR